MKTNGDRQIILLSNSRMTEALPGCPSPISNQKAVVGRFLDFLWRLHTKQDAIQ
jgi:hypothetical protein